MKSSDLYYALWIVATCTIVVTQATEREGMIIEIPNGGEHCFYQKFNGSVPYIMDYAILRGGNLDIDAYVSNEAKTDVYSAVRKTKDTVNFDSSWGEMSFCFSNKMSTVTHKVLYFNLMPKIHNQLSVEVGNLAPSVKTFSETTMEGIHDSVRDIRKAQMDYRFRANVGYIVASDLRDRVNLIAAMATIGMVLVSVSQTLILKSLFNTPARSTADIKKPYLETPSLSA